MFFINIIFTSKCYKMFYAAEERYGACLMHSATCEGKGKGKGKA